MEKGTLVVIKTKRGYAGKIQFTKKSGKLGQLPITGVSFKDDTLNGKPCEFQRDKGKLTRLVVEGKDLYGGSQKPKTSSNQNRNTRNNNNTRNQKYTPRQNNNPRSNQRQVADSLSIADAFLPKDVLALASSIESNDIDNFSLKLNKAARYDYKMHKFQFFKRQRKGENYEIKAFYGDFSFGDLVKKHHHIAKASFNTKELIQFNLTIDWRMAHGLGHESVYETSITLHHTYGIPYIPASSLKGVVRSWIITQVFVKNEDWQNAEKEALKDKNFCDIFGCGPNSFYNETRRGQLVIYDAFPTQAPKVSTDVMNTHYGPY